MPTEETKASYNMAKTLPLVFKDKILHVSVDKITKSLVNMTDCKIDFRSAATIIVNGSLFSFKGGDKVTVTEFTFSPDDQSLVETD